MSVLCVIVFVCHTSQEILILFVRPKGRQPQDGPHWLADNAWLKIIKTAKTQKETLTLPLKLPKKILGNKKMSRRGRKKEKEGNKK